MFFTEFLNDIEVGNIDAVIEFKKKYPDIDLDKNHKFAMGASWLFPLPLVVAFKSGHLDIARFLIKNGADLDAYCYKNHTTPRELMPKDFVLEKVKTPDIIKDFL